MRRDLWPAVPSCLPGHKRGSWGRSAPGVRACVAGVRVGDAGGEELIGGEQGVLPGAPQDGGRGGGVIEGLGGRPKGGLGRGLNHGDIGDDNILYRAI